MAICVSGGSSQSSIYTFATVKKNVNVLFRKRICKFECIHGRSYPVTTRAYLCSRLEACAMVNLGDSRESDTFPRGENGPMFSKEVVRGSPSPRTNAFIHGISLARLVLINASVEKCAAKLFARSFRLQSCGGILRRKIRNCLPARQLTLVEVK